MWNGTEKVFFVGICGVSLSALALILKKQGHYVCGSDNSPNGTKRVLEQNGIKVFVGHDAKNVESADIVVCSAAISKDNPEIVRAKELGLKILSRAELLGELSGAYKHVIAISGSHGKTTTTAMITSVFVDAGKNPTVHIGGNFSKIDGNVRLGGCEFFITEACEYCDSFLSLHPEVGVILNVQADHLDYFGTEENVKKSFCKFASQIGGEGLCVFCKDDRNAELSSRQATCKAIGYSDCNFGDIYAKNVHINKNGCFSFDVFQFKNKLGRIKLSVPGRHNIKNALATICACLFYKIDFEIIAKSLSEFSGVDRRFQFLGEISGAKIFHDYAHHPTEISASIETAKTICSGRVFVVFQPHTYSRTESFFDDFAKALAMADEIVTFPIYPAREDPIDGVSSDVLAEKVKKHNKKAICIHSFEETILFLHKNLKENDICLLLGAGDIVDISKLI